MHDLSFSTYLLVHLSFIRGIKVFSFVVILAVAILFSFVCSILLGALNNSMLKLFVPIQRVTSKLKRKKLYSNLTLILLITISAGIREHYTLSDMKYGLLLGFFFALQNIMFDTLKPVKKYKVN